MSLERQKQDEFKMNFDIYNAKRMHQPALYNTAVQVQRFNDLKKCNSLALNLTHYFSTSESVL